MTKIGEEAFGGCLALSSVIIKAPLLTIEKQTFTRCTILETIELPATLETIEDYAFHFCTNLRSVNLHDGITHIGDGVFDRCEALEGITLPKNLTFLGLSAFRSCDKLVSVTIPASLTAIGSGAFSYCESLATITLADNHPTLRSIDGVLFNKSITTIVQYPGGKIDTHYLIPDTVESFEGTGCFAENSFLEEITIPESIVIIGDWAFVACINLKTIHFPQSLEVTGWVSFANCTKLQSVTIPEKVTTINNGTFTDCTNLRRVVFEGPAPDPQWGSNAFRNIASNPYALVKPQHALSFGGVGASWRGMEVLTDDLEPVDPSTILFSDIMAQSGLSGQNAEVNSDPENRGITSGLAYALGLPISGPLNDESRTHLPRMSADSIPETQSLAFRVPIPVPGDVTYLVLSSTDLVEWKESSRMNTDTAWTGTSIPEETENHGRMITKFIPPDDGVQNDRVFLSLKIVIDTPPN